MTLAPRSSVLSPHTLYLLRFGASSAATNGRWLVMTSCPSAPACAAAPLFFACSMRYEGTCGSERHAHRQHRRNPKDTHSRSSVETFGRLSCGGASNSDLVFAAAPAFGAVGAGLVRLFASSICASLLRLMVLLCGGPTATDLTEEERLDWYAAAAAVVLDAKSSSAEGSAYSIPHRASVYPPAA